MGLDLPVDGDALGVFLLVLARTSAWVLVIPIFAARGIIRLARLGLAVSLAIFLTPLQTATAPAETSEFALAVVAQVALGLAMGLLTAIVLSAVEIAGGLADFASGFSYGAILDPVSGAQSAAFARLTTMTFLALLFATSAHHTIIGGFVASFRALPVDVLPALNAGAGPLLGQALSGAFVTALLIGAPLLGVLFLTEVALGLAGRFVPQANALVVGLPVKSLVALSAGGTMLALLPQQIPGLVEPAIRLPGLVLR
jgi:flagellar biosynthesis protein FliR